jgi:hypothetical protein
MGKTQLKSANNPELYEIIDRKMKSKNISLEIKIEKEYNRISNNYKKEIGKNNCPLQLKQFSKCTKISKEEIFLKWYKMKSIEKKNYNPVSLTPSFNKSLPKFSSIKVISPSTDIFFKKRDFAATSNQTFSMNSEILQSYRKHNNNYNLEIPSIFSEKDKFKTINFQNKDKNIKSDKMKTSVEMPTVNEMKSSCSTEKGLRKYFKNKKEKFYNRTVKGPPDLFRWVAWMITIGIPEERSPDIYGSLKEITLSKEIDNQIKKDLHRTLSENNLFLLENASSSLYQLLKALAIYDKEVSYCQGMNFIAGFLLIVSEFNEVECFYMLLSLFTKEYSRKFGIRGFYLNEFPMLNFYIYTFDHIFKKNMPDLKSHFQSLEVPNDLWVSKWYQALFTNFLPFETVCRIWDCLIVKGLYFIHNFTIAILQILEKDLLTCKDICDVAEVFNTINPYSEKNCKKKKVINVEEIIENALKIDIPVTMINKIKCRYERSNNFELIKFQNLTEELNNSINVLENPNEDLSCTDFFLVESNLSFLNNLPKTAQNSDRMFITYENQENIKSTLTNSNTNKNEDQFNSDSEELGINESSVCSEVDLFEKSRIDHQIKNYVFNTKIINKNNKHPQKIKLIKKMK